MTFEETMKQVLDAPLEGRPEMTVRAVLREHARGLEGLRKRIAVHEGERGPDRGLMAVLEQARVDAGLEVRME